MSQHTPMQCVGKFLRQRVMCVCVSATVREFVWGFPTCTRIRNATVCILMGSHFLEAIKKKCNSFEMSMKNGEFLPTRSGCGLINASSAWTNSDLTRTTPMCPT